MKKLIAIAAVLCALFTGAHYTKVTQLSTPNAYAWDSGGGSENDSEDDPNSENSDHTGGEGSAGSSGDAGGGSGDGADGSSD